MGKAPLLLYLPLVPQHELLWCPCITLLYLAYPQRVVLQSTPTHPPQDCSWLRARALFSLWSHMVKTVPT